MRTCFRNPDYLKFVRTQPCASCNGRKGRDTQAAHVRIGNGGGMGIKPSDYRTVPLCSDCHAGQHLVGEKTFWEVVEKLRQLTPDSIILNLLCMYAEKKKDNAKGAVRALETFLEGERQ